VERAAGAERVSVGVLWWAVWGLSVKLASEGAVFVGCRRLQSCFDASLQTTTTGARVVQVWNFGDLSGYGRRAGGMAGAVKAAGRPRVDRWGGQNGRSGRVCNPRRRQRDDGEGPRL